MVYIIVVTDVVGRGLTVSWTIAVYDTLNKAEEYLEENGCVWCYNPAHEKTWTDGIRSYDIEEWELNKPCKEHIFCHAAGV